MTDDRDLAAELRNAPEVAGPDPDPGAPANDSAPPDRRNRGGRKRGEIFDGSPVKALGVYGDVNFYIDVRGQLRGIDNHSLDKIRHVFGGRVALLGRHFPQFTKEGAKKENAFNQATAAAAMVQACDERGVWSPTGRVRGAGCWTDDDGNLVFHAGDKVLIGGKWEDPGVHGDRVYPASDPVPRPADREGRKDCAAEVLSLIQSWNWARPAIDPQLALGLVCAQMIGGALDWRPVAWLTGDAATGKSTFQKLLLNIHGGEAGLLQAADATEAGIRSVLGYASLPVAIDELEPDADNPRKVKAVVELARRAASGAQIFRGSSDQKGYQSNAYSCFLFSSILMPPMPPQDRSRLIVLDLATLAADVAPMTTDWRRVRLLGAGLRRRLIKGWPAFQERLQMWRAALAEHGQTGRGADNYGTVLALADMAMSPDDLPSNDTLHTWCARVGKAITEESVEVGSNAEDMLFHLVSQYYDVDRRGERFTLGQYLLAAAHLPGAPSKLASGPSPTEKQATAREINAKLAKIGLRVRYEGNSAELFIPNRPFSGLCELFEGSPWADGVWSQAAKRVPGAVQTGALTLAGASSRGCYVPFRSISGLLSLPADTEKSARRGQSGADDDTDAHDPDPLSDLEDFK